MTDPITTNTPPLIVAGAKGLCPRCHAPTLFDGAPNKLGVGFADHCRACGLDYGQFNVGDGPAAFLTLIIAGVIGTLAIVVDNYWTPPLWAHVLLWVPLTMGAVIGLLRVAKGMMLIDEYRKGHRSDDDGEKSA